jgi:hypothetical protein
MRRVMALLLVVLLLAPELPARDTTDWKNVMKLRNGTQVLVWLWNGHRLAGRVESVSDTGLQVATRDGTNPQASWLVGAERAEVRRIVRYRGEADLPDPERVMLIGTAAGIGIGGVAGGILDATGHNQGRGLGYAFIGGTIGLLGSVVVLGVIAVKTLGRGYRREELVYEDKSTHAPNR